MKDKSDPTESTLNYYQTNSESFIENTVNVDVNDLYRPFLENIPSTGKILDAGCGSGRDTKFFLEKGSMLLLLTILRIWLVMLQNIQDKRFC